MNLRPVQNSDIFAAKMRYFLYLTRNLAEDVEPTDLAAKETDFLSPWLVTFVPLKSKGSDSQINALVLNNTARVFLQQQSCYIKSRSRGTLTSLLAKCVSGNSTFFVWQILLICKVQLKYFSNGIFSFQPLNTK